MTLTYANVAEIVKIIDASSCDEVELELEGAKLSIRRNTGNAETAPRPAAGAQPAPAPRAEQPAGAPAAQPAAQPAGAPAQDADANTVCSPMVGTFYTRPSPEEPEFAPQGTAVEAGAPICIIEVMKLFTTIEAPHAGTVSAILAKDGDLVEYDQPLFLIDPA